MNTWRLCVPAVLVLGAGVILWIVVARSPEMESANIFEYDPALEHILRANLGNAEVVIPGRPHPLPFLFESREYKRRITKRIAYRCSTNSLRFRGPELATAPVPGTVRIACLGDSITFGHGVGDDECYPAVLRKYLATHGSFEVVNAGVQGYDSEKALLFLRKHVLPLKPGVLTICIGVNDTIVQPEHSNPKLLALDLSAERYRETLGAFRRNLLAMLDLAQENSAKVILLVPPVTSFFPFPDIERYCRTIRQVALERNVPLLDLQKVFREKEHEDGLVLETVQTTQRLVSYRNGKPTTLLTVRVRPGRKQYIADAIYDYLDREPVSQRLAIDGSHPNAEGHRLIAELLSKCILGALKVGNEPGRP